MQPNNKHPACFLMLPALVLYTTAVFMMLLFTRRDESQAYLGTVVVSVVDFKNLQYKKVAPELYEEIKNIENFPDKLQEEAFEKTKLVDKLTSLKDLASFQIAASQINFNQELVADNDLDESKTDQQSFLKSLISQDGFRNRTEKSSNSEGVSLGPPGFLRGGSL